MSSLRYNVESVVESILSAQSALTGLELKHFVADEPPAKNRLVIKAEEPQVDIPDAQGRTAKIWRVPVTLTLYISLRARSGGVTIGGDDITIGGEPVTIGSSDSSAALLDAYGKAILDAMQAAAPAAAVALAQSLFPSGIEVHPTDETEVGGEGTKLRTLTRTIFAIIDPTAVVSGDGLEFLDGAAFAFLSGEEFALLDAA